mgnify:CR=1 FL=1
MPSCGTRQERSHLVEGFDGPCDYAVKIDVAGDSIAYDFAGTSGCVRAAVNVPSTRNMRRLVIQKERAHLAAHRVEQIWDFYFELFGQRQSRFGDWLLGCDRIALDCYQATYRGLGAARSVP